MHAALAVLLALEKVYLCGVGARDLIHLRRTCRYVKRCQDSSAIGNRYVHLLAGCNSYLHLKLDHLVFRLAGVEIIIVDESEPEIITLGRVERLCTTEPVRVLALHRSTGNQARNEQQEAK